MSYRSIFVFENATNFGMDWSQLDYADDRPRRLGFFTRIDEPYSGPAPVGSWIGRENTLTIIRADEEHLTDLFSTANDPPSGGANGTITVLLRKLAEDASHRLPALVNVFYRPEVLRFSSAFGRRAIGPGGMRGGLSSLPQSLNDDPLLTLKVPLHINTPPGMSSIDAELVFYIALRIDDGRVAADVVGGAHPWRFHGDGYGAYQNEINDGLGDAVREAMPQLERALPLLLGARRANRLYLVPGRAVPRQEPGHPVLGRTNSFMTLALAG